MNELSIYDNKEKKIIFKTMDARLIELILGNSYYNELFNVWAKKSDIDGSAPFLSVNVPNTDLELHFINHYWD